MQKLIAYTLFTLVALAVQAQSDGCVNEIAKNPTYQCTFPFSPICACDGKTYFNQCDAFNHGGIEPFSQFTSGVCGDWEMFLGQDAPNRMMRLFFQFDSDGGSLTFMIVDSFGKIMQQMFINTANALPIERDISTVSYPPGIYIAYAFGGTYRKTIKFSAGNY